MTPKQQKQKREMNARTYPMKQERDNRDRKAEQGAAKLDGDQAAINDYLRRVPVRFKS